ncbi:MAG: MauE/DoxX family redox-associated membrane protein [Acidobacteriota bacterium]
MNRLAFWRRALAWAGCAFAGGMLLVAGLLKALDPAGFATQIRADVPWLAGLAGPLSVAGIAIEVVLGSALILGFRRRFLVGTAMLMVLVFIGVTIPKLGSTDPAACGCFGNFVVRTPGQVIGEDLVMLVALLVGLTGGSGSAWSAWRRGVLVIAAGIGLALPLAAPALPLDNVATRLKPGASLADLQLDEAVPDLATGHHFVILSGQSLDTCADVPESLFEFTEAHADDRFWLVKPSDVLARDGTLSLCVPGAEIVEVPAAGLRPLYRTLPRSFEMVDGIVTRTFEGYPAGS